MDRKKDKVAGTDHLEAAMHRIAKIEDRRTGCKHRGRLPRVLHHCSLNNIPCLNAVMEMPGKLIARFEFADRTHHLIPAAPDKSTRRNSLRCGESCACATTGMTKAIAAT